MKIFIIIGILLLSIFHRANASDPIFLKLISDEGDTTNVFLSDVVKIDTVKNLLEFSPGIGKRLKLHEYPEGKILLNTGNRNWEKITYLEGMYHSYPHSAKLNIALDIEGNIFLRGTYDIVIWGDEWKIIAKKYGKVGTVYVPNAFKSIFVKIITPERSNQFDSTYVYLSDVIKIDTTKGLLELAAVSGGELKYQDHSDCKILLNTGNGKWVNVNIYGPLSKEHSIDPSIYLSSNTKIILDSVFTKEHIYVISIRGETWKTLAKRYQLIGNILNP